MQHRYSAARQMRRARRELKRSKLYLGRVYLDIVGNLPRHPSEIQALFAGPIARAARLLTQERDDKKKLYAFAEKISSVLGHTSLVTTNI